MGSSFYADETAVEAYLTHRHRPVASPNLVMEEPAVDAAIGDVSGRHLIDLGCGDGTFAVQALERGCASYLGIDASAPMIRRAAEAVGADAPARFVQADIAHWAAPAACADLITARMVLHYLAELEPTLTMVERALEPGGRFVASIVHPLVSAQRDPEDGPRTAVTVDDYFDTDARARTWFGRPVVWQHRTIEHYLSAVLTAGLRIDTVSEGPPVPELFQGDTGELERRRRVPLFLVIGATKPIAPVG